MRVLKIIQAYPEIFDSNQSQNYSEIEAIRKVAAMECKGSDVQKENFAIRQTHTAISNLMSLGFTKTAIDLALDLIPRAQKAQQYKVAQDLCDTLINYYYKVDDLVLVQTYKELFDKLRTNVSLEHKTLLLCGNAINNYQKVFSSDGDEINVLLEAIKYKLPLDTLWYHYYYYKFQLMVFDGGDLENVYHEAIGYFKNLHFKHDIFIDVFCEGLIIYYLKNNALIKAETQLDLLEIGSNSWFSSHLHYTYALLQDNDIKSHDICSLIMNHPQFPNLSIDLKEEWRKVYRASVKLLLDN